MVLSGRVPSTTDRLAGVLSAGGVAVAACDTIYGFLGRAPDTEERIRSVKGREESKPFLLLAASASWLPRLTAEELPRELSPYWPGPLTLIFASRDGGSVAVRVPADQRLQKVLSTVDAPLFSTSVNRSGEPPYWEIARIVRTFDSRVDLIVDDGDLPGGAPSTILDVRSRPFRLVRQGVLALPPELLGP